MKTLKQLSVLLVLQFLTVTAKKKDSELVVLTDRNFDKMTFEFQHSMILFHSPWCPNCQKLMPKLVEAAKMLKKSSPHVSLATVNCMDEGRRTCHKFNVVGYPTLNVFMRGILMQRYDGPKETKAIVQYMQQVSPGARNKPKWEI